MEFIFMLTRDDQTIHDCLDVVRRASALGVRHIGFKDIGVEGATLEKLNTLIRDAGATSYLEVVSTTRDRALTSARLATAIGVDRLLGGTWVEATMELLEGTSTEYLPFVGYPEGHPTRLGGSPESVAADVARYAALGCAGVDLLAYRAFESDPIELVRSARSAFDGDLVVAGNVATAGQVQALFKAGADAFTIGSAVFAGAIEPRCGLLEAQLQGVLDMLSKLAHPDTSTGN